MRAKNFIGAFILFILGMGMPSIITRNNYFAGLSGFNIAAMLVAAIGASFVFMLITAGNEKACVKKVAELIQGVAQGSLTQSIKDGYDRSLEEVVLPLNKLIGNVRNFVGKTLIASNKVATYSENITGDCEAVSKSVEEISVTINEISQGIESQAERAMDTKNSTMKIVEDSQAIANFAENTYSVTQELMESVNKSMEKLEGLTKNLEKNSMDNRELSNEIKDLTQGAKEIKDIIAIVKGISEQTNLLALNAAIEAARAGEVGKGFAVVAEEVRKLAEESEKSASRIREIIERISQKIDHITQRIEVQVEDMNTSMQYAREFRELFDRVYRTSDDTLKSTGEIVKLAGQGISNAQKVDQLMEEISAVTQQTAAGMEEINASTQEEVSMVKAIYNSVESLTVMAKELTDLVREVEGNYKLTREDQKRIQDSEKILKDAISEYGLDNPEDKEKACYFADKVGERYKELFEVVVVIDSEGHVRGSSMAIDDDNLSHRRYFKEAIKGKVYVTEPYISSTGNYCVAVAVPVTARGRTVGVVLGDVIL